MAKRFYGITAVELRRLAFQYAEKNEIQHRFNTETKIAGFDWLQGFLKRNPKITLRKPEATSLSRIEGFNKDDVKLFFQNLEAVMTKFKFGASRIYNCDETGITTVQKPGMILGPKGQKQVGVAVSLERGKNVTVHCAFSASGNYIPPLFIYPRKRISPQLSSGGPDGAIYKCSDNGWINEDIFYSWLDHFKKHTKPTEDDQVLLVMDNHCSHKSLRMYDFCKQNFITVVTIPPHTSHRLQPLDVAFYSPLKSAFNRECDLFMKANQQAKITPYDLASLFNKAYQRIATIEKAASGFRATGIFPLDPERFTDEDFAPAVHNTIEIPNVIENENDVSFDSQNGDQNANQFERNILDEPSTSTGITSQNKEKTRIEMATRQLLFPGDFSTTSKSAMNSASDSNASATCSKESKIKHHFGDIIPQSQPTISKPTNRRKQHSQIMTSTPMKAVFEEQEKKRTQNAQKGGKHGNGKKIKAVQIAKKKNTTRKKTWKK
ncbi:uncharacterized protein LOC116161535 [Photinus pyralis]|uniref:uncharacterized protein LOC116161535 n=1 Tax=Photinus pyralis TaxID=7054 RepID=UPI001266F75D|nr:uncharacterized protein LOC116161535 [Photinus pyralis]